MSEHVTYTIYSNDDRPLEVTGTRLSKHLALRVVEIDGDDPIFVQDHIPSGICWPFATLEAAITGASLLESAPKYINFTRRNWEFAKRHAEQHLPEPVKEFFRGNKHRRGIAPLVVGEPAELPEVRRDG